MLDPAGKPTPRLRALTIREELEGRLQRLEELERWISDNASGNNHELLRADAVAVAIDHVRQAMEALEVASRE